MPVLATVHLHSQAKSARGPVGAAEIFLRYFVLQMFYSDLLYVLDHLEIRSKSKWCFGVSIELCRSKSI